MTSRDFWDGDEPNAVNLFVHPFARKSYVQRQIRPIRDRINELDGITASNSKMIKNVDASAQQGVQLVSAKINEADQHAIDASNRAQTAQLAAAQATAHLSKAEGMVGKIDQYKAGAQTEIRFRAGQSVLSKKAKDALDEVAAPLKDQHSYIIEVRGFAPGRGRRRWRTRSYVTWCSTIRSRAIASSWWLWVTRRWPPKAEPRPSTPVVGGSKSAC